LSPLVSTGEALEKLVFAAKRRIPLVFTPCPIGGGTAPVTAAGVIIQGMAESWTGLTIAQALQPGLPYITGGVYSVMDMSTMVLAYGAPELPLMMAGVTELAHYAGLPVWQTGGCTDSKTFDAQAMIEGSLSVFFSTLTGGDLCHDVGYTESAMTGSVFQLAAMDEAIGYSRRFAAGIRVDQDTTRERASSDSWRPELLDRSEYAEWAAAGRSTMKHRTVARVREILQTHQPSPIKPATRREIQRVLEEAENQVAAKA
jgi:trimethylamine--corrinoid protein Co-methyltransferase